MKGKNVTVKHLDKLVAALRSLIHKDDKQKYRRIIFVGDQDNKLHRALKTMKNSRNVRIVDQMISDLAFDMKVLSASANNEGWTRRGWPNVIEQDIDEVPDKFAKQLFPHAAGDGGLEKEVRSKYNGYPLFWGLAEKAFLRDPNKAYAEFTDLCAEFFYEKCVSAAGMVAHLNRRQKDEFLFKLFHQGITSAKSPKFYDRNLFQICKKKPRCYSLKPICHAAVMCLWDVFPLTTTAEKTSRASSRSLLQASSVPATRPGRALALMTNLPRPSPRKQMRSRL
jgi:hypothetical protein